jgi:nucleoside-diphosphate-sugar epimerase
MKYLITGGAGFLGIKLAEKLLENKKNKIYLIDNLSKNIENKSLKKLLKNKNVKFIKKDLSNISSFLKIYNFDYIFHFAAILGVKKVIDNPFITLRKNIETTIHLINFSKKQKRLKKLCFTSTSEVYAQTLEKKLAKYPTPENIDFLISRDFNPRSAYLLSKIVGEYLMNYSKLNFVIFRPHNIFGPEMGFSHVIPQLIKKFLINNNNKILIQNSNHKRTFCYIDFAIELIINISHKKNSVKKIFNIGSPEKAVSIIKLATKIKKILNSKKKLSPSIVLHDNSPKKRKPDMTKGLNYTKKKHNFEEGLNKTVLWYKKYFTN